MAGPLDIGRNLERVLDRIAAAARRAGRDPADVRLVAISKSHPVEKIIAAYEHGQREFGENRVAEGIEKQSRLGEYAIRWHMVGHIQSRRAEAAARNFDVVHSVDRLKIARSLDQHRAALGDPLPVYLELNVSGEESKSGWDFSHPVRWPEAAAGIKQVFELEHLLVAGLMTMAPWVEDESLLHATFARLREARDFIQQTCDHPLPELSMGMTDDFEIAIAEGATVVRIGRAIFGERE